MEIDVKGVVFDLDGTLVDSVHDIAAAANSALSSIGLSPLSNNLIRSFIGNGIPKLMERVMRASKIPHSADQHRILTDLFIAHYTKFPAENTVLYQGVASLLKDLKAQGYIMGICTNKNLDLTLQVLDSVEISQYFTAIIGGDSLPVSKPDPAPLLECIRQLGSDKVIYVGDSEVDANTAKAAKMPLALFTEGYRKSPVDTLPHTFAFSDFTSLGDLLDLWFQGATPNTD